MLKIHRQEKTYLITQPDHAQVAGYLAAHWGNEEFSPPGSFAQVKEPELLRSETVLAVAQHDNGWWEWESFPELAKEDGYPLGLREFLRHQEAGMERWRIGIPRVSAHSPYAGLIAAAHAYWLYAPIGRGSGDARFLHPLFWQSSPEDLMQGPQTRAGEMLKELEELQEELTVRLRKDSRRSDWLSQEALFAHVRLQQICDALSLSLSEPVIPPREGEPRGLGEDAFDLQEVPRRKWEDRVKISVRPLGEGAIQLDPYPFDQDPLPVHLPARIFDSPPDKACGTPTWWQAQPITFLNFEYRSQG